MTQGRTQQRPARIGSAGTWHGKIWQRVAAAAIAGLPVALAVVLIWIVPAFMAEPWLDRARTVHAQWAGTARITGATILNARNYLTGLRKLGPALHLPDLTAARLRLNQVSYVPPAGDRPGAIHAGYVGRADCRLSLWITPTREAGSGALVSHSGEPAFSWYANGLRYVLVTADMQDNHFHLIAKTSREMTLARQGPSEPVRAVLGLSAAMSRPCKG